MIHGLITDTREVGRVDGFDVYAFIVADPAIPDRAIITVVAARNAVELGFAHRPYSERRDWKDAIPDAVSDARDALTQLIW